MTTEQHTDVLPPEEAQALTALDEAKRQIELARIQHDVDKLLEARDTAAAYLHYIQRRNEARDIADNAGEVKVRAEAALGQLDRELAPHGGKRESEENGEVQVEELAPLAEVRPNTRAMWRKLGQLDSQQLDSVVANLRSEENESRGVTTARALALARELLPTRERGEQGEISRDQYKEMAADFVAHVKALDSETSVLIRTAKKLMPRATDAERRRFSVRLGNTIARLNDLQETIGADVEETDSE